MSVEHFGRYRVELSNTNKILFPADGITKSELIRYYSKVGDVMIPHLKDRPLTLRRFPDAIDAEGFYQQQRSDYFPDWIKTSRTPRAKANGEAVEHVLCNNQATLVYLANQATITLHGWLSRASRLRQPDRLVFDLDPSEQGFGAVRRAARLVAERMEGLGMTPFAMTTGSKGLHVVAPLRPVSGFDEVREVAQAIAASLAEKYPDELTVEKRKVKRRGRIYLDVMRNAYGQTAVMPYSARALPGAPVATPLALSELEDSKLDPQGWNITNLFQRLGQKEDPWSDIRRYAVSAGRVQDSLNKT